MNLKERFMNQLEGKAVDMTPVGCTTTYGMGDLTLEMCRPAFWVGTIDWFGIILLK